MKNIFNMENPVWVFIGRLVDVVVLNVLWMVCSIPIVTFGPATVALHYSLMKTVKGENPKYVRNYFRTMKENMLSGIPVGLVMLITAALIVYSIFFYQANAASGGIMNILKWMAVVFAVLWIMIFQWVWALSSRFVNTALQTVKNAMLLAVGNFPWTVVMIVIMAVPIVILYYTNFIPLLLPGYGLVVYLDAYILNKVLDPMIKKAKEEQGIEEDEEEERYTEEEIQAMTQWQIPRELSGSSYAPANPEENAVSEAEETAREASEEVSGEIREVVKEEAETAENAEHAESGQA